MEASDVIKRRTLQTIFLNRQLQEYSTANGCTSRVVIENGSGARKEASNMLALALGATLTAPADLDAALEESPCIVIPPTPTGLTAIAGNQQATITFTTTAQQGTMYTVTASPGGFQATGSSSPLTVTGLTNGIQYTFTVIATNDRGTSDPSSPTNAVTPATVPAAPTNLSATGGSEQATIAFTAGSNGGLAILNYEYSLDSGATWTARIPAATTSPILITGLTNNLAYTISLRATNALGPGTASAGVSVTPAAVPPPGAPTLKYALASDGATYLYLTPGTGTATNYAYTLDDGATTTTLSPEDYASPILIPSLTNGTPYTIKVAAINSGGSSALSNALTATPSATPTPDAWLHYDPNNVTTYSGSGTAVNNIGAYGAMTGTSTGNLAWITGTGITRKVFNLTGGYIAFGAINFGDAFTIAAWVRPTQKASINAIITNGFPNAFSSGFKFGWNSWQTTNKNLLFENGSGLQGAGNWTVPSSVPNTIVFGEWQHVACVYDRIGKTVVFMRNGSPVDTADITTALNATVSSNNFNIGAYLGGSYTMLAELGELKVFNSTLSAYQVAQEFNATKASFGI
jgi:hypothetical protein